MKLAFCTGLVLLGLFNQAQALDFRVATEPALMREAPNDKGAKLFILSKGTPVELVLTSGVWSKVRDVAGNMAWVESRALADKPALMVRVPRAQVRGAADDKAALVFEAEKEVLLEATEKPKNGWVAVRHRDGAAGFVRVTQVWGL